MTLDRLWVRLWNAAIMYRSGLERFGRCSQYIGKWTLNRSLTFSTGLAAALEIVVSSVHFWTPIYNRCISTTDLCGLGTITDHSNGNWGTGTEYV